MREREIALQTVEVQILSRGIKGVPGDSREQYAIVSYVSRKWESCRFPGPYSFPLVAKPNVRAIRLHASFPYLSLDAFGQQSTGWNERSSEEPALSASPFIFIGGVS